MARQTASPEQICHAKVYGLTLGCTAYLDKVYGISYTMRENEIWTAEFELAVTGDNDDKNQYCLDNHYVELFDTVGTRIELFRIVSADAVRRRGQLYMHYKCEHALATLLDKSLSVEMNAGPGTVATITALLAMQDVAHWQLGTCDFARNFLHYWTPGTSLLAALWQISGRLYDETWQWTFDTTSHPWTLNLVEPGDDVVAVIDYRLNMQEIKRHREAKNIINKIYPRGNGAGVDELTIMSINITGAATTVAVEALPDQAAVEVVSAVGFAGASHVYLENAAGDWEINDVASVLGSVLTMDNDLQHTYGIGSVCHIGKEYIEDATSQTTNGIKSYPWKDERYTIPQNLYDAAIARLAVLKDPAYTYTAKAINLHPLIDEHQFQLGELVRIRDNDLDILVDTRVTVLKQRDVTGKPQDIEVQTSNKVPTFGENMGNIIYADDLDGVSSGGYYSKVYTTQILDGKILLSAVPGGLIGSMPNPPAAAGAYLSAEYIGIHDGTNWITYMDNAARLIADDGSGDAYFKWDPTLVGSAKLQIKGDVSITGTLSASKVVGGTLDFSAIGRTGLAVILSEMSNNSVSTNQIVGASVVTEKLHINASLSMGGYWTYGVKGLTADTTTPLDLETKTLDLENNEWKGYSVTPYAVEDTSYLLLNQNAALRGHTDLTIDAQAGDLVLKAGDDMWFQVGGGTIAKLSAIVATDSVSLKVGHEGLMTFDVGGVLRYVAFREPS